MVHRHRHVIVRPSPHRSLPSHRRLPPSVYVRFIVGWGLLLYVLITLIFMP